MRVRMLLLVAALVGVAAGVVLTTHSVGGDGFTSNIGLNTLTMRSEQTTYRLTLAGHAVEAGPAPRTFPDPGSVSPGGRYRVDSSRAGVAVIDGRTHARRQLTADPYAARTYWGSTRLLAFADRKDGLTRLVIFDPATGARHVVASHLCGDSLVNPWSPDGRSLAIPVSPAGGGCNGRGGSEVAVADTARRGMRRIAAPGTTPIAWNGDGSRILIADRTSGALRLVDPRNGKGGVVLRSLGPSLLPGEWSTERRFYAVRTNDQAVAIIDASLRRVLRTIPGAEQYAWSPDRQWLAVSEPAQIRVLDAVTGRNIAVIPAHTPHGLSVLSLAWDRHGRALVAVALPAAAPLGHD